MKSKIFTLAALSATLIGVSACTGTNPVVPPAPGKYETTTNSTNSNGTDVKVKKTTYVSKDANGRTSATTQTKTTNDPKGLMNKSTSTTTDTTKY